MTPWAIFIFGITLFIAYANGANDNFKGVATLFGSGATDYKKALWWATLTTFAGSAAALFFATELLQTFRGRGLVPGAVAGSEPFLVAVILGAALTVFFATKIGMPISTTHSLTGALTGAGLVALGPDLGFATLWQSFLMPLLLSPLAAVGLAVLVSHLFRLTASFAGLTRESCICVGEEEWAPVVATPEGHRVTTGGKSWHLVVDQTVNCMQRFTGTIAGVNIERLLNSAHYLSAGAVSFARGLNDTPKIVALSLAAGIIDPGKGGLLVALLMAWGGLLHAQRVAETMSRRITGMNPDEGLTANLVTSFLVIFASRWGLPVSTTHVSCGALIGVGAASGNARWAIIRSVVLAWVLTLPVAALLSGAVYSVLHQVSG